MKVAILYICTGKYNQFFQEFFSSCEKFFLPGIEKDYFVFTDNMNICDIHNVYLRYKQCEGFPKDSLFRFEMFLNIKKELKQYDYIFFFNSILNFCRLFYRKKFFLRLQGQVLSGHYGQDVIAYLIYLHIIHTKGIKSQQLIYLH